MSESPILKSVPDHPESSEQPTGLAQATREARCLVGWMEPTAALQLLTNPPHCMPSEEATTRVRAASWAVANRMVPDIDQGDAIGALPDDLQPYVAQLQGAGGIVAALLTAGWQIAMVDIRKVHAFQPLVYTDGEDRVGAIDPSDLLALAKLALPAENTCEMNICGNEVSRSWVISSADPNLRFLGLAPPTPPTFGFGVGAAPSLIQVVRSQGRLLLRDGYHRCAGLSRRGIFKVPAMVLDKPFSDQLVPLIPPGMLPPQAYLGDRPPTLADYFDEEVSCLVRRPRMRKAVVLTATEVELPY
jgi:hypothetical protein